MPNWELHGISSFYIYVLILRQTEDRSNGLAKPAENNTRRKQSIANIATTNEYACFATAGKSIATVVEASLTIRGLIVVRG